LTLKIAASRWWNEHGSTLADKNLKSSLDRMVELIGPSVYLHAVSDDTVARFVVERRKDVRRDSTVTDKDGKKTIVTRAITPSTVNRSLDLLRRVMNRAFDNWNASIPRMPKWRKHRLKERRRHVRELTPSEETALDQVESFDYAELRRFMIVTGLRRRDALITWPQVDFELAVLRVITKGDQPRVIPMTKEIYAMLWRRRGQHAKFVFTYQARRAWRDRKRNGLTLGDLVKGQRYPITYAGLGSNKRKWKKAGVDARIHDLRHTAGSRTTRARGIKAAQILLGHTGIAVTSQFYSNISVEDLREAMEATAPREILPARLIEKKE